MHKMYIIYVDIMVLCSVVFITLLGLIIYTQEVYFICRYYGVV